MRHPLPIGQNGGGRVKNAVEIYKDGEFVHWFPSQAAAAKWLGIKENTLSLEIKRGHKPKGYEVRIGESLDDTLKRINSNNTYQFTKK